MTMLKLDGSCYFYNIGDHRVLHVLANSFPTRRASELKLKYKVVALARWANQAAVTAGGSYILVLLREELLGLYFMSGNTSENINNILAYFYQEEIGRASCRERVCQYV